MNVCIIKVSRKAKDNVGIDVVGGGGMLIVNCSACHFFFCRAQPRPVDDDGEGDR